MLPVGFIIPGFIVVVTIFDDYAMLIVDFRTMPGIFRVSGSHT